MSDAWSLAIELHRYGQDQETPLIVIILLAAILTLVGITAVSAIDLRDSKRR